MMTAKLLSVVLLTLINQSAADKAPPAKAVDKVPPTVADKAPPAKNPASPQGMVGELDAQTAQWLVELAQHQGHQVGRTSPRSASLQVIGMLEAARATDPNCADAYYWLYDLYQRMDRAEPARDVLAKYVELTPTDEAARLRLLDVNVEARQSAEDRIKYIRSELEKPGLSAICESELRRRLAKLLHEQRDDETAGKEIERSLRLNPTNVAARELAYEMFGETEAATQRVELALQMISINPTQANLVWELGEFLDRLSMHKEAQEWFNRAVDMHRRSDSRPIPAEYWQKLAMSYLSSGDYQRSKDASDAAQVAEPTNAQVRLIRAAAVEKMGDEKAASADRAVALKIYEDMLPEIIDGKRPEKVAEAAWFFCYHHPDAKRAMELATIAEKTQSGSSLGMLARGYALRQNGKTDEAMEVLKPLAGKDQLASLELARALIDKGDKPQAIAVLQKAATLQYSGIAYRMIGAMLEKYGEKPPQPPEYPKVKEALAKFHRDVFDFPRKPDAFLKCAIRFEEPVSPLGPVKATIRMENIAPFPITLGEGYMVRPLAAITAKLTTGNQMTDYPNYLQMLINRRPLLLPGDAIEKTVSIDLGPIRQNLCRNVLRPTTIELSAMIDPVFEGGNLTAGPGTVRVGPIRANRPILDVSPTAINLIIDQATDANPRRRIESAQGMAAIIAAAAGQPIEPELPAEKLKAAIRKLVVDDDWHVRSHALAACELIDLDAALTQAAAPAVKDSHPVVRLMAVRLFAAKQGGKFMPVLEQLSRSDASSFVRMTCASYLPDAAAQANASGG